MNIWEGGRRVRLALALLIVGGSSAYWLSPNTPSLYLAVNGPNERIALSREEYGACVGEAAYKGNLAVGNEIAQVIVCYRSEEVVGGSPVIFSKPNTFVDPNTSDSEAYFKSRWPRDEAELPRFENAVRFYRQQDRNERFTDAWQFAAMALAFLFISTWLLGWIVKGFTAPKSAKVSDPTAAA